MYKAPQNEPQDEMDLVGDSESHEELSKEAGTGSQFDGKMPSDLDIELRYLPTTHSVPY